MIAICTTLTTYAMGSYDTYAAWLLNAEDIVQTHDVKFFVAIEVDDRGIAPFEPLLARLKEVKGEFWSYSLNDGRTTVHTNNRLRHITMGQQLASEYATSEGATHMLFVAADCSPPHDVLPKLLEVDRPIVGAEVPTYCLSGTPLDGYGFPVERQLASAACILIERDVFKQLKWRADPDTGMSDDPAFQHDALQLLGIAEVVRKDCVATHYPESINEIENRYPNRNMSVVFND